MKNPLHSLIAKLSKTRILVLGDFILDEYLFGEISRISREAPVLILKYQETRTAAGGGANTVANVAALGAEVVPVGFIGDDEAAGRLLDCWPSSVNHRYVFRDGSLQTTRKVRLLAGSFHSFRQQVVRLDYENPAALTAAQEDRLIETLTSLVPEVDALLLSDYSLGNLSEAVRESALRLASEAGKILVVDSRDHPDLYAGATSITPNITEIEAALSLSIGKDPAALEETGFRLLREWNLKALLVTRGRLGMSLFTGGEAAHIPICGTDEVVDVTGAGDTVMAVYGTALAAGASYREAALLANCAAGTVVTKRGTAAVSPEELVRAADAAPGVSK